MQDFGVEYDVVWKSIHLTVESAPCNIRVQIATAAEPAARNRAIRGVCVSSCPPVKFHLESRTSVFGLTQGISICLALNLAGGYDTHFG